MRWVVEKLLQVARKHNSETADSWVRGTIAHSYYHKFKCLIIQFLSCCKYLRPINEKVKIAWDKPRVNFCSISFQNWNISLIPKLNFYFSYFPILICWWITSVHLNQYFAVSLKYYQIFSASLRLKMSHKMIDEYQKKLPSNLITLPLGFYAVYYTM